MMKKKFKFMLQTQNIKSPFGSFIKEKWFFFEIVFS